MKKVLFVLFAIFVFNFSTAQANDVRNGKGNEMGAYFSTDFGDVIVYGDFGSQAFRANGGGPEKSFAEYDSSFITFAYWNPITGGYDFLNFWENDNPSSMYFTKNRKHASLTLSTCNSDGYCANVDVDLLGYGDLLNEPFRSEHVFDCRYYRFQSISPYRKGSGVVSYEVLDPAGDLLSEGSQPTVNANIFRGMYTVHEMDVPGCDE